MKKRNILVILGLILANFLPLLSPRPVHADFTFKWIDANGDEANPDSFSDNRFIFLDPDTIKDTETDTQYDTTAGDELFNDGSGDRWNQNGWFWFWPKDDGDDSVERRGQCTGALLLHNLVEGNLTLNAVGAYSNNPTDDSCYVPRNGLAGGGALGDTKGKGDNPDNSNQRRIDAGAVADNMAAAVFRWKASDQITGYNTAEDLRPVSADELRFVEDTVGHEYNNSTLWTSDNCAEEADDEGHPDKTQAVLIIDNDTPERGNMPFITIEDDGDDDFDDGFQSGWNGDQLDCMLGGNYTPNPVDRVGEDGNGILAFIAHPEEREIEPGDPDYTPPAGDSGTEEDACVRSGPLGWIICDVLTATLDAIDWFRTGPIRDLLQIRPLADIGSGSVLLETWRKVRNVANVLFILAFIVIIYSQAVGGGRS